MTTRELKNRLERLESRTLGSEDDLLANMPVDQLLELYLQLGRDGENEAERVRWSASMPRPSPEEVEGAQRRVGELAQRGNAQSICSALSTRELLVLMFNSEAE